LEFTGEIRNRNTHGTKNRKQAKHAPVGVFTPYADVVAVKIKAVIFDLGNTLVWTWIPEVTYQSVLSSLGVDRSTEDIREAIGRTEEEFRESSYRSRYGEVVYTEYWNRWDKRVLEHLGISEAEVSAREILARWYYHADCGAYPDTVASLNRLKQMGLRVGLISTAYEEDIDAILKKAGLEKSLFDVVVGANTIKKEKPHPDVFRYALSRLNVEPDETLFVGDHVDNDYRGARAVGIHALLIERENRRIDDASDLERIRSLEEIFRLIDKCVQRQGGRGQKS
jgi:putative hydrolase of the HAD superfamily